MLHPLADGESVDRTEHTGRHVDHHEAAEQHRRVGLDVAVGVAGCGSAAGLGA